jgi:hypothetical protein
MYTLCILRVFTTTTSTPDQDTHCQQCRPQARAPHQQDTNITNCKRVISQEEKQAKMHSRGAQACKLTQMRDVLTSLKPNVTGKWYCGRRRNYRAATATAAAAGAPAAAAAAAKVGSDGL